MSDSNPDERVALVTGASGGIGKATVRRLLKDGWTAYGAARRLEEMTDIESEGARILYLDLTNDESMRTAVGEILTAEERIDALVNNAGYGCYGAVEDVPMAEARRQFEVNLFGLARLIQLVLPTMRQARSGTIVNVSSMGGRIWTPIGGWYHASKHALEVLSDVLRVEVRPFGIRVVVIQPGPIETEWSAIAAEKLLDHSKGSVYEPLVEPMARALRNPPFTAGPAVVAKAVSKAVNTRRPRRRYATQMSARLFIFLRWLLPDWAWERLVRAVVK